MSILTAIEYLSLLITPRTRRLSYEHYVARVNLTGLVEIDVIQPGYPIMSAILRVLSYDDYYKIVAMQERLANTPLNISGHCFCLEPGNGDVVLNQNMQSRHISNVVYIASVSQVTTK